MRSITGERKSYRMVKRERDVESVAEKIEWRVNFI